VKPEHIEGHSRHGSGGRPRRWQAALVAVPTTQFWPTTWTTAPLPRKSPRLRRFYPIFKATEVPGNCLQFAAINNIWLHSAQAHDSVEGVTKTVETISGFLVRGQTADSCLVYGEHSS
jgi:hypothetical protein